MYIFFGQILQRRLRPIINQQIALEKIAFLDTKVL
jgi:hypothetical protein